LVRVDTREGPRAPAYSPEATGNAQKRYLLGTPIGLVEVVQITGLIARRCVAYSRAGSPLRRGERFGMVLFGSRVDVVLPKDSVRVVVRVGTRVHAGSTTIAELVR
ncbi:MAG: phosphatidylserine decarboxylase, partial [Candidatus Thermoplasmatota archaeon]|nr:phosphatidylserine decarboxylase [Candidatus Thermoplasmatota archaeon]